MLKKILLFFAFVLNAHSQIVINELDCNTPSIDDKEFIELKSETANFPLDGYVLVLFNGTGTQANLSYYVVDLDGHTTDVNGIFLIGNSLVSPVPGKLIPEVFQNGPDGVGLYLGSSSDFPNLTQATTTNLIDALVYDTSDADATALMTLLGVTVQIDENQNGLQTTESIQRKPDGTYEIKTPTPGANNDGSGFIFNGLSINLNAFEYNEGQQFTITITSQTNVLATTNFNISLSSGGFNTSDYTGNVAVSIPVGTNTFSTVITLIDDVIDEGDETAKIRFTTVPTGFNMLNNNIEVRVVDNDYYILPFGTPINPTYGIVNSTAPNGYYSSLEGLSGATLKQAVQDIIANSSVVREHNYGDIETILKDCDQNPLNSNQVWLMYAEEPRSKLDLQETGINTGKWNREHIYPQSRGGFTDGTSGIPDGINVYLPTDANDILAGHADAHHIRAEDAAENSLRSNKDYGEYVGPTGTLGSWRGDVARAVFYMAVRYNGLSVVSGNPANTTVGQLGDLDLLLQWNVTDTADDFEMNRNNYIYTWQVNRNPFIDYPNLADYIFGANFGQPWFSALSNTNFTENRVVVYPNPAKDFITIAGFNSEYLVEIFNNLGSKIYESKFVGNKQIETNWESGIYFAKITSNSKSVVKKIVVE